MQVTITLTATIDIDELESTLDAIDYHSLKIESEDVTIYGDSIDEKVNYLKLCDTIGGTYSYYCTHHKQYYTEAEYNDNYIGTYSSIGEYAREYIQCTVDLDSLPSIITDNIDYDGIAEDLTTDFTVIDIDYNVAIYRY